jgi:hypothetical protein
MLQRTKYPGWALPLAALLLAAAPVATVHAQSGELPDPGVAQERYSENQLDNLVGPVALYPDALLAQVLIAATFPDQIEEAARHVRAYGTDDIDDQPWDVIVKAVAHYLPALNMMAEKIDWTATLGRAYAGQSSEVMRSVQRLRALADAQGNLVSNEQQQVVQEEGNYTIVPTQPQIIYVPTYDPFFVYSRPLFSVGYRSPFWSFGIGFPIGSWLIYDVNWGLGSVYYNGWNRAFFGYAGGWRARSFPFVRITNVYVSPRHRNVYVNRNVWRRPVNYGNVNRYRSVHRETYFGASGGSRSWDRNGGGRNGGGRNGGNGNVDNRNGGTRNGGNRGNGSNVSSTEARIARARSAEAAASANGTSNARSNTGSRNRSNAAASASSTRSATGTIQGRTSSSTNRAQRTAQASQGTQQARPAAPSMQPSRRASQPSRQASQPSRQASQPSRQSSRPSSQPSARQAPSRQSAPSAARQAPSSAKPARQSSGRPASASGSSSGGSSGGRTSVGRRGSGQG